MPVPAVVLYAGLLAVWRGYGRAMGKRWPTEALIPCASVISQCIVQDSWVADEFLGGSETALFGVFDGHGIDGRKVSNGIAARLPKLLADCTDFKACRKFRHVRG